MRLGSYQARKSPEGKAGDRHREALRQRPRRRLSKHAGRNVSEA